MAELNIPMTLTNSLDGHVADAKNIKGTYVVVSGQDGDTKENIPLATRKDGMLVYDALLKTVYRYYEGRAEGEWLPENISDQIDSSVDSKLNQLIIIVDGGPVTPEEEGGNE